MKKSIKKYFIIIFISILFSILLLGYFVELTLYPLSEYKSEIITTAKKYDLPPSLVFAIIRTESRFNKNAVSDKGAVGLMQLTISTAKYVADLRKINSFNLTDEKTNIDFGCYYFKYLMNKFNQTDLCLAAYNAGEGNVKNWLLNPEYSPDRKNLKTIPLSETCEYVKRVNKSLIKYQNLYFNILDKR